jgi:hypothetical protein
MKNRFSVIVLVLCLLACAPTATPIVVTETAIPVPTDAEVEEPIARPFPQHVEYAPGSILPTHRTQEELDDDVRTFYDYWKSEYLIEDGVSEDGSPMYRVAFGKSDEARGTTVSEGQGYGMMIVPIMAGHDPDAQIIFDGLWAFARAHPSEIDPRLMDWIVPDPAGNDSAFDDADIAFGRYWQMPR